MIEEKIRDWAKTLGSPLRNEVPKTLDERELILGWDLIREETHELTEHILDAKMPVNPKGEVVFRSEVDVAELADDLGDILWVTIRFMQQLGLDANEVIGEVYRSNMSKICLTEEDAIKTVELYKTGKHPNKIGEVINCHYKKVENIFAVLRTEDNKIMKSYKFKEPNFDYAGNIRIEKYRNSLGSKPEQEN